MVGALVLLSLLLLVSVLLLLSLRCLCLMCFGGRRRGARLVGESRKWGLMMLSWLILLAFYPPVGASCDIFLSAVGLGHY
jgi:formate hydrogenlyase subunit 3/multisubunit Na+/H+ antiporter MnhD subunit